MSPDAQTIILWTVVIIILVAAVRSGWGEVESEEQHDQREVPDWPEREWDNK